MYTVNHNYGMLFITQCVTVCVQIDVLPICSLNILQYYRNSYYKSRAEYLGRIPGKIQASNIGKEQIVFILVFLPVHELLVSIIPTIPINLEQQTDRSKMQNLLYVLVHGLIFGYKLMV